jgi:hypothetical protein
MPNLDAEDSEGRKEGVTYDTKPDLCTCCQSRIDPVGPLYALVNRVKWTESKSLQVVYRCPNGKCRNLFISYHGSDNGSASHFRLCRSIPITTKQKRFSGTIQKISEPFCKIFNEAQAAEDFGLMEICGVRYRKALEFLIKDYIVSEKPDKKESILKMPLGSCIQEYIQNGNLKVVAKRAVWLGNDETHYLKVWESKDVRDLKMLIDLTLHWVEAERLTKDLIEDMPEKS